MNKLTKTMLLLLISGAIALTWLFFLPKQDVARQWDGVYRAELSDIAVLLVDPDRVQTMVIALGASRPSFVIVKGQMKGPPADEFAKFSVLGNLFRAQIGDSNHPVWRSYPSRVDISPDGSFQFEIPVMVRRSTKIGQYDVVCSFKSLDGERRELDRLLIEITR